MNEQEIRLELLICDLKLKCINTTTKNLILLKEVVDKELEQRGY